MDYVYRLCLARPPAKDEAARLENYLNKQKKLLDETPGAAAAWSPALVQDVDRTTAAAWTGLAKVLLNLDEFVTRE